MSVRTLGAHKAGVPHVRLSPRYDEAVLAYSPAVHLRLDDASNRYAVDYSGNGRQATITGSPAAAASTVMPSGSGALTMGSGKYLTLPGPGWQNPAAWTAIIWARLTSTTGYQALCNRDGSSSRGWNFYITSGKLNAFDGADHLGATTLSTATAYMCALTWDGTSAKVNLNGVQDGSFTGLSAYLTATPAGNDMYLGGSIAGSGAVPTNFPFAGDLDYFAFIPQALTAAQLLGIYQSA